MPKCYFSEEKYNDSFPLTLCNIDCNSAFYTIFSPSPFMNFMLKPIILFCGGKKPVHTMSGGGSVLKIKKDFLIFKIFVFVPCFVDGIEIVLVKDNH